MENDYKKLQKRLSKKKLRKKTSRKLQHFAHVPSLITVPLLISKVFPSFLVTIVNLSKSLTREITIVTNVLLI